MSKRKLITFDYGATSGRAILGEFDGKKLTIEEYHRFDNQPVMVNGHLYWDILRLFHELKQGLINISREGINEVDSIGIDTWGVDFALLDKDNMLLNNPFHYRDTMTDGAIEKTCETIPADELYNRTGIQFIKFNTLFQLATIKEKFPRLLENADTMLFIPDYLNFLLTGVKSTEFSIASTSQMYNLKTKDWDYDMIDKLGIPRDILQKITPSGRVLGDILPEISDETGIKAKCISVCGHDTGSAVLAVPMEKGEKCAWLSCGTWSLLGVELEEPITSAEAFDAQYSNEGGYNNTVRFLKNIMGLWVYTEIKREFEKKLGKTDYKTLDAEVNAATPLKAIIDPDDDRFMTPGNMTKKIREFCIETGQTPPETRGEFLRCALESLALKYRFAIENCEKIIGDDLNYLRIVGGGTKDKQLMQYTANAIRRPVIAGPVEATAIGNMIAQLLALGEAKDRWEARQIVVNSFPVERYEPQDADVWEEAYNKFKSLIKK